MSLTIIWGGERFHIGGVEFSSSGQKIKTLKGVQTFKFNSVATGYGDQVGYQRVDKPVLQDLSVDWNKPRDAFINIPEQYLLVLTLPYALEGLIGRLGRSYSSRSYNELWALSFENKKGGQLGATPMEVDSVQELGLFGMIKAN